MSNRESNDSRAATDWPMASVIVAVYNGGRYLSAALDSVFAQDYHQLEVIVVDDGSTDDTAPIAKSYPAVRYINQDHQGVATARNAGLAAARGQIIALQDADDLWVAGKLALQVGYLLTHPEVGGTIGMHLNFADGTIPSMADAGAADRIGLETLVVWRVVFDRVGAYKSEYRVGSDMEWLTRARDVGETIVTHSDILAYRRIHGGNLSRLTDARTDSWLRIMRASIDRKREKAI